MNLNLLATTSIEFPNLHISLNNLPKSFSLFGVDIAFYGVIIAFGMLAGIALVCYDAKSSGQDYNLYIDFAMYAIILSVIGARLYYVVFSWDYYSAHPLEIINIREGGLAIYGGVIAGIITCIIYTKIKKISFFKVADSVVLGLILGQIIGRWGNYINIEAYGTETNLPLKMEIIENGITKYVHPTFLYESVGNFILFLILLKISKKRNFSGQITLLYFIGYAFIRFFIEGLRTDSLMMGNIRASQLLSLIIFIACTLIYIIFAKKQKNKQ